MVIVNRSGARITSVEEWAQHAPPASAEHWKDGRSAIELASAWCGGAGPATLQALFETRAETRGLELTTAVAEAQTAFDPYPGGKRNHDLLINGSCAAGPVVVGLEAKADESFGGTVKSYRRRGAAQRKAGEPTNAPERLHDLLRDIAGPERTEDPKLQSLRYQLFSGIAGTLAAAQPGELAAFVVHVFATGATAESERAANVKALAAFTAEVLGARAPEVDRWLIGPFHVPAERWQATPLYVGYVTTHGAHP